LKTENCFHCGDNLGRDLIIYDEKSFCCNGCKQVYVLIKESDLSSFYSLEQNPGYRMNEKNQESAYNFLDLEEISQRYVLFKDDKFTRVKLFLPSIHCSSCIYLLENLHKINSNVISAQVDFIKKEAIIDFSHEKLSLSKLANLLNSIGYKPNFGKKTDEKSLIDKTFLLKIGLAGFAFGSIMLWSVPEYGGIENDTNGIRNFTSWLSFFVSLPVLLYSANDYFISAYKGIRTRFLNLDIPISIGILALYGQSLYTIVTNNGPGYMDSFSGFIFFLLIGKWFQNKTYRSLSFDRDFTSYFPVAVTKIENEISIVTPIEKLKIGDVIELKNEEIIPCDANLNEEIATLDYSFITGESMPITKKFGEFVYAGGKILGEKTRLTVKEEVNRSHLTKLWNTFDKSDEENSIVKYQDKISYYFLIALLIICLVTSLVYFILDISMVVKVVVSILIVACPCALALSAPFTFGHVMRVLGRGGLYLKNTFVIEKLLGIDTIIFDKTGTLTDGLIVHAEKRKVLNETDSAVLFEITGNSTHPLAKSINQLFSNTSKQIKITDFKEEKGLGVSCKFEGNSYKVGSAEFCNALNKNKETTVYFAKNDELLSVFTMSHEYRENLEILIKELSSYELYVVSGDSDFEKNYLIKLGFKEENLFFNSNPEDKKIFVQNLKKTGRKILMVGDGLNDTGALTEANVGIAISSDMFRFTPTSDAILDARQLGDLPIFLNSALYAQKVLRWCLGFSLFYNTIGLTFAISGSLTPLVAAILMPVSSLSVVMLSTLAVQLKYKQYLGLKNMI
jgi:Cu+-exporting ATPase